MQALSFDEWIKTQGSSKEEYEAKQPWERLKIAFDFTDYLDNFDAAMEEGKSGKKYGAIRI